MSWHEVSLAGLVDVGHLLFVFSCCLSFYRAGNGLFSAHSAGYSCLAANECAVCNAHAMGIVKLPSKAMCLLAS